MVALFLAVQFGAIFWLGERPSQRALATRAARAQDKPPPMVRLVGPAYGEWLALRDPTMFALPHREGFSGPAWMVAAPQESPPFVWSEPLRWLELIPGEPGTALRDFLETQPVKTLQITTETEPELTQSDSSGRVVMPEQSSFRVEGDLASRRLLTPLTLPSWTNADLLTNTVVRMLVDGEGKPVSLSLVLPGCGHPQADQWALDQARSVQFESVLGTGPRRSLSPLTGLSWGQLVFQWQTLPLASTNGVP
jgi:hypothetical protein